MVHNSWMAHADDCAEGLWRKEASSRSGKAKRADGRGGPGHATRRSRDGREKARELSEEQILRAVQTLYTDGLKPYGRILRKRLTEHAADTGSKVDADLGKLRLRCKRLCSLSIVDEHGGEWSAVLAPAEGCQDGSDDAFVDVYSPADEYSEAMWDEARAYCASLSGEQANLPGGRYACAKTLYDRNLPFLEEFSLGQVCHIVQLAICKKKILGYVDGGITPYAESSTKVKDAAAAKQEPSSGDCNWNGPPATSWDEARRQVKELLDEAVETSNGQVALSNIKHVFRIRFDMELSETALGHSKLSELLQDQRLSDICEVKLFENGYFVMPPYVPHKTSQIRHDVDNSDEPSTSDELASTTSDMFAPPFSVTASQTLHSLTQWIKLQNLGVLSVKNTFVHMQNLEAPAGATQRAVSVPPMTTELQDDDSMQVLNRPRVLSDVLLQHAGKVL